MSHCPLCQTLFECSVVDHRNPAACWCMALPRSTEKSDTKRGIDPQARCLCPDCLRALRDQQSNDR